MHSLDFRTLAYNNGAWRCWTNKLAGKRRSRRMAASMSAGPGPAKSFAVKLLAAGAKDVCITQSRGIWYVRATVSGLGVA